VPFNDPAAIALALSDLLSDDERREELRERAHAWSRSASWPAVGERYRDLFAEVAAGTSRRLTPERIPA
jgi:glycosyltransferase involved in cell wall biosynthesis